MSLKQHNNLFELFNLEVDFNIDLNKLKKNYFILQKKYHPDKFKEGDESSSFINSAFIKLKDPLSRAIEVLKYYNVYVEKTRMPLSFLEEQFLIKEKITTNPNNTDTQKYLNESINDLVVNLNEYLSSKNYVKANECVSIMRFYYSSLKDITSA